MRLALGLAVVLVLAAWIWIRSLPVITIRARVYRASPAERALPTAEAERRYALGIREGHWEDERIIAQQRAWPWSRRWRALAAHRRTT